MRYASMTGVTGLLPGSSTQSLSCHLQVVIMPRVKPDADVPESYV